MAPPIWMEKEEVLVVHDLQLAEHGGAEGIRDEGLLDSALARPKNLLAYAGKVVSLTQLAAAYAYGIAANHPFVDGNKRTALVTAFTFMELNGIEISAIQEDVYMIFWLLAQAKVSEQELAVWLNRHSSGK
ncbi:MAG: type II toxin-antitoxin system death-on-curing family toxin [Acidobacteriaceae bacterium]